MTMRNLPPFRLGRPLGLLACLLGAALAVAPASHASVTIGFDTWSRGNNGQDLSFASGTVFYIPFKFDFAASYSLDSLKLSLLNPGSLSAFSLHVTSALGTDTALATLSATGAMSGAVAAYTFYADTPAATLDSGTTYYLRMAYTTSGDDPQWVNILNLSGDAPADQGPGGGGPVGGGPPGGGGDPRGGGSSVTLTPLSALNPASGLTFEYGGTNMQGYYGVALTASAVPEPATTAMLLGVAALGVAWLGRRRRRR